MNTAPTERDHEKESKREEQKALETIRNAGDTKPRKESIQDSGSRREIKICVLLERHFARIYFGLKLKTWNV